MQWTHRRTRLHHDLRTIGGRSERGLHWGSRGRRLLPELARRSVHAHRLATVPRDAAHAHACRASLTALTALAHSPPAGCLSACASTVRQHLHTLSPSPFVCSARRNHQLAHRAWIDSPFLPPPASPPVAWVWRVDDVIDAFAVHGACGLWSLLACGLMANGVALEIATPPSTAATELGPTSGLANAAARERAPGLVAVHGVFAGGGAALLGAEMLAAVAICTWAVALSTIVFGALHRKGCLRITDDFELIGIDLGELGRTAYSVGSSTGPVPTVAQPLSAAATSAARATATSEAVEAVRVMESDVELVPPVNAVPVDEEPPRAVPLPVAVQGSPI